MYRIRPLTSTETEEFFDRGYTVLRDVFSPAEVAEMRSAFDGLECTALELGETAMFRGSRFVLKREDSGKIRIQRIVWCGAAEPALARYGEDPRLLTVAARLLGSIEMNQLINQAHFKLPGDDVSFPWHQDSTHRRYGQSVWRDVNGRGSYVQTVTAVDDVAEDNGPLQFIPGSCKHGHVSVGAGGDLPWSLIDERRAAAPTMSAGSVLLFGPYTFHSSRPNLSNRPRRVLINGYAYPGANTRIYPGEGSGRLLRAPDELVGRASG